MGRPRLLGGTVLISVRIDERLLAKIDQEASKLGVDKRNTWITMRLAEIILKLERERSQNVV